MMEAMLRRRAGAQTMDERAATCRDLGARRPRGRRARRQCGTSRRSAILVHRYYDPSTGQFLSVDPTVANTKQPYVYASNNPINRRDVNGKSATGCTGSTWFTETTGVCITILGTTNVVDQIKISDGKAHAGCDVAQITIDGNVTFQSPVACTNEVSGTAKITHRWGCSLKYCTRYPLVNSTGSPFESGDTVCGRFYGTAVGPGLGPGTPNTYSVSACETIEGATIYPYSPAKTGIDTHLPSPLGGIFWAHHTLPPTPTGPSPGTDVQTPTLQPLSFKQPILPLC